VTPRADRPATAPNPRDAVEPARGGREPGEDDAIDPFRGR
jgi:hypothetical protein